MGNPTPTRSYGPLGSSAVGRRTAVGGSLACGYASPNTLVYVFWTRTESGVRINCKQPGRHKAKPLAAIKLHCPMFRAANGLCRIETA